MTVGVEEVQYRPVVVVGGGVVGICCALWLQREGFRVVVVERQDPGMGTTIASCGSIAVSEVVPLSKAGNLRKIPRWLLDPKGPLTIRAASCPRLLPWFLRFMACARPRRIAEISSALSALTCRARLDYAALLKPLRLNGLIGSRPVIELYHDRTELAADRLTLDYRLAHGFEAEIIGSKDLHDLEPNLAQHLSCGVLLKDWRSIKDTFGFVKHLTDAFIANGGTFKRGEARRFNLCDDGVAGITLSSGEELAAGLVIVAAGAWSKTLLSQLGRRLPLEGVAGYQTLIPDPNVSLTHAVVYARGGFGLTPMESGLGIAGTVEFSGLNAQPNFRRAKVIAEKAKRLLPGLETNGGIERVGYRPMCPDTLPILDMLPEARNVIVASGHGQLGVTLGATTGRIVADLAARRIPSVDLSPYRITRF